MQSLKRVALCCGFVLFTTIAPGWLPAQELVINGKDFESGAGDAKLAEIARQAAATGKTVVVTTPPYWQAQAIAKLHAGSSSVQLKTSDAFFENVMVRVVGNDAATKPAPDPAAPVKVVDTAHPAPAKPSDPKPADSKPVAAAPVPAKAAPAKPEPPRVVAAPAAAAVAAPPVVSAPEAAPPVAPPPPKPITVAKIDTPPPASVTAAPSPAPVAAPVASSAPVSSRQANQNVAEARQRLEAQLGLGKGLDGSLKVDQLQKGDQIFVQGPARAVVRRNGSHTQLFWLEGPLNLERTEIAKSDAGRYRVEEPIRNVENPTLRAMHSEPKIFTAHIPAANTSVRSDIERHFNEGKLIAESLHTDQLQYADLVYCYRTYAVILRRTDVGYDRYWLDGPIDLNQAGVVKDGDAYRVVSDRL